MSDAFNVTVDTKEEAHQAARHAYALAQVLVLDGKRVKITCAEDQDALTVKQRGFLHAAVFPQIAEQVVLADGTRYIDKVWKEYFRARFLPDVWEMRKAIRWDPKTGQTVVAKRATPHRVRQSTEDLGVKAYSEHIDRVIDTAVAEFGVRFEFRPREREEVRYRRPERKTTPKTTTPAARPQPEKEAAPC